MAKDQVNIRVSTTTREKLDFLTDRHGTQTEAVAVAIDRLYQEEKQMKHNEIMKEARQRVESTELSNISHLIFSDWDNMEEHLVWVARADINEILDWARDLDYLVDLSGDIHQMQDHAWNSNVGQPVDDFMLDYEDIEESVDDYLEQYEDMFQEPIPTYYGRMTHSYYTLRELLIGYLEEKIDG